MLGGLLILALITTRGGGTKVFGTARVEQAFAARGPATTVLLGPGGCSKASSLPGSRVKALLDACALGARRQRHAARIRVALADLG